MHVTDLTDHMNNYFQRWKVFHKYWLSDYKGNIKVILYKDLVKDINKFTEVAEYFGYRPELSKQR